MPVPALRCPREVNSAERLVFVGDVRPKAAFSTTRRLLRERGERLVGCARLPFQVFNRSDGSKRIVTSGAQVFIRALVGRCAVEVNRVFAAAGSDARILRFGVSIDGIILCGAKASDDPFTALHRLAGRCSRTNDRVLERHRDADGDMAPPVSGAGVTFHEGLRVSAGLATVPGRRNSEDLARHLNRPLSHPATRRLLDDKPVGRPPSVFMGKAGEATLDGVAAFPT